MKLLHLIFLVFTSAQAKILDESQMQNGLMAAESTTLPDTKNKVEQIDPQPNVPENPCFHADVDAMCFNKSFETKPVCECETHPKNQFSIVCCNLTDINNINKAMSCVGNMSTFLNVHIINLHQKEVDVEQLNQLKHITGISITDGNITKVSGQFPRFSSIKCLNFSNNNITEINERFLFRVPQLEVLDLSANNLTRLPTPPVNAKVDVRGNRRISCKNVSSAYEHHVVFLYKDISFCEVETIYSWFNSTASVSLEDLEKSKNFTSCPSGCKCESDWMSDWTENRLIVSVKVDCSNLGLTELPLKLPENTLSLNISNNSITSLSALTDNSYYANIRTLFADDNLIRSIVDLEGSTFLENFTKLSLKNNKIKDIPTYILSNLERNLNGKLVYLGGNRIQCDCQTFKNQRMWRLVQDCAKILCDNMNAKILELKESQMCKSGSHDWASYIIYVIVIEVILLVALVAKVSYDWFVFKNSGFLPYPASWIILYNHRK